MGSGIRRRSRVEHGFAYRAITLILWYEPAYESTRPDQCIKSDEHLGNFRESRLQVFDADKTGSADLGNLSLFINRWNGKWKRGKSHGTEMGEICCYLGGPAKYASMQVMPKDQDSELRIYLASAAELNEGIGEAYVIELASKHRGAAD